MIILCSNTHGLPFNSLNPSTQNTHSWGKLSIPQPQKMLEQKIL